jgi:hypothetical protein
MFAIAGRAVMRLSRLPQDMIDCLADLLGFVTCFISTCSSLGSLNLSCKGGRVTAKLDSE